MADGARRTWLRVSIFVFAVLASSALGAELYLRRHWFPPPAPARHVYVHPPRHRVRVKVTRDLPGLARRSTQVTTNSLGVRGEELDLRVRDRKRVLTLGDSVTECLLLADRQAWPRRLQDLLAAKTGRPVWVGNAGSSGHLSLDYIAHMRVLVPTFAPDLVVVMPGGYDLQAAIEEKLVPMDLGDPAKLAAYAAKLYAHPNDEAPGPSYLAWFLLHPLEEETLDMTDFYARMRVRRASTGAKLPEVPGLDDALDVYTANLRGLVAAWRSLAPRPRLLMATSPSLWKTVMPEAELRTLWGGYTCMDCADVRHVAHEGLAAGIRRFHDTMLDVCRREDVPCLDLDRFVAKTQDHFYDDAHLTAAGADQVARQLGEFIAARHLLD